MSNFRALARAELGSSQRSDAHSDGGYSDDGFEAAPSHSPKRSTTASASVAARGSRGGGGSGSDGAYASGSAGAGGGSRDPSRLQGKTAEELLRSSGGAGGKRPSPIRRRPRSAGVTTPLVKTNLSAFINSVAGKKKRKRKSPCCKP